MRILQVNKFHYERGGADIYYLELGKALEEAGHEVAYFSMHHPKNLPCKYSSYFVSRLSFNEGGILDKIKAPGRIIYSLEAKRKFNKLVQDFKPDIIHIHNIYHQISPSILDVARKYKVPAVMHLHDYKLICPNYQLFANGKIWEDFKPNHYFRCVNNRCFKNSLAKSFLAALEMHIHHSWLKIYKKNISAFIAPSAFMKNKIAEYGWDSEKIKVIINPFSSKLKNLQVSDNSKEKHNGNNDYLLFFGRLSKEKGLETLIKAAQITKEKIKLAGSGPEKEKLEELAKKLGVEVEFLGFKSGKELMDVILKAKAVVIPSIWYENMPLSLLEALSLGKPVIAANIGGLPEIIKPGENGYLFEPNNPSDLSLKINEFNKSNKEQLAKNAIESVNRFTTDNNLKAVLEVYSDLLK